MKKILVILLALCIMFSLVACSGEQGSASSDKPNESSKTDEPSKAKTPGDKSDEAPIEVEIWHYFEQAEAEYLNNFMTEWGDENGYKFKITAYPFGDLNTQYTLGLVSGVLPDLTMINNCDNATYIEMGMLQDITDYVETWGEADNFYASSLKTTTKDGRIYGLPYNSNCIVLYYDVDMLAEAGVEVPKTWDEFSEAAKKLSKDNTYGFAMSLINTDEGTFQFFPFLYSTGADMYTMGSDGAINALNFLKKMVEDGSMSSEVVNWSQADACQAFKQGNAAMMLNGPWQIPGLKADCPDKNWAVAPMPIDKQPASALGGEGFSILKGADLDKCWPVMEFMFSKETLANWCYDMGKLPPRKDSIEVYDDWVNDETLAVFFDQLNYAAVMGPDVHWPEISKAIYSAVQSAMTGQLSVEDACEGAAKTITNLTQG